MIARILLIACAVSLAGTVAAHGVGEDESARSASNEQVQNRGAGKDNWWDSLPRPEWSAFERIDQDQGWFEVYRIADGIFAIYEPGQFEEVISFLITGDEKALLFDTGLGIGDMKRVVEQLTDLEIVVLNSHTHYDHIGGNYQFETIWGRDTEYTQGRAAGSPPKAVADFLKEGWIWKPLPEGFVAKDFRSRPFTISRFVDEGDVIDLGGRKLEILSTPGHAPDAICLLDRENRLLLTGDSFYLAPLYTHLEGSDFLDYARTAARLAGLADDIDAAVTSHNVPVVEPHYMTALGDAFAAIENGTADDYVVADDFREYRFDGFSIIVDARGPAYDCSATEHEIELLICDNPALSALDWRLFAVRSLARQMLRFDSGLDFRVAGKYFEEEQLDWIEDRNQCFKAHDRIACTRASYERRIARLQARYFLVESGDPMTFLCNGNEEIEATFVPTDPPTVRLKREDIIMIASLVPTASGTKYDGDLGTTFWTKGDDAMVEWPKGTRFDCRVR
jgi:glyoxylase-like metal-dependent hydrolase (beta-lactamase superfamily II)/membrane-bound inhibitor of C-type lysozyme